MFFIFIQKKRFIQIYRLYKTLFLFIPVTVIQVDIPDPDLIRGCPVSLLHNQTRMQRYRCLKYLRYLHIYLR